MDRAYNIMPLNSIFKKRLKMKNGEEITVSPWLERGLGRFSSAGRIASAPACTGAELAASR